MVKHYLTVAFRSLKRYKLQNFFCIAGLTIGFSAFVFGSFWWHWENNFDGFHPEANRTYAITTRGIGKLSDGSDLELNQVHKDDIAALLKSLPEVEKYSRINHWGRLEYEKDQVKEKIVGIQVDAAFFSVFYSEFISGGYQNVPFDGSCIVLTEKAALKLFETTDCTGEIFSFVRGSKKIAGVIKDYPSDTDFKLEYIELSESVENNVGRSSFYVTLHQQADVNTVRKKVEAHESVADVPVWQGDVKNWSFRLRSLSEVHLTCNSELKSRFLNIQLLGFAGLLALICALMNALVLFIGLQQRKQSKNKTFKSLGASKRYLFRKSILDLAVPIMVALALTAIVISVLFPYYQTYTQWQGNGIYENYSNKIDTSTLTAYSFQWLSLTVLVFLLLSSLFVVRIIRQTGFRSFAFLRNTLIVSQIFIGCFFFFISLSLFKQVQFTQKTDKGIVIENITQVDVGYYTKIDFQSLKDELLRSPHIEAVTFTTNPVLTEFGDWYLSYIGNFCFSDHPEEKLESVYIHLIEPDFFTFFGIKIKTGNQITTEHDVIINETQRQALSDKNPVGKPIKIGVMGEAQISGIIEDYYYTSMQYPIKGLFFHSQTKEPVQPYQYVYVRTKPENHAKAIEQIKAVLEKVETGEVTPGKQIIELTDIQEGFNRPEKILFRIFGFLSFICILVVSFGIYSLVTLTIEQRRKEIAIRKINGAEIRDILVLFLRNYLILVIIGNMLSLPIAHFFINKWLENYVYRTTLSWWLFAVVFIATCLIVLFSIFEKVRMAAKENPVESLTINN